MAGVGATIGIDEPATVDKRVATKTQTRSGQSVHIEGVTLDDPVEDRQARINASEQLEVHDSDVAAAVATLLTDATFAATDFASEASLAAAVALLTAMDADTSNLDVALSSRASEATLASLDGKDFATQATVATLLTDATFAATDFATETTLEAARVLLAAIDADTSNLDVALSTLLSEATFSAVDFATETSLSALLATAGTNQTLADYVPALPFAADAEFTSDWVDIRSQGHLLVLIASTVAFDTVELEWSDDGSTPNGQVSALANQPTISGPFTYNVHLSILNIFLTGDFFRVHVINGTSDQDATMINLASVGKHPYFPLIGVTDDISFLSEALLVRSISAAEQPDGDLVNVRASGLARDVDNVDVLTSTPLAADAVYQTGAIDTDQWESFELYIVADQPSADGGIVIEFTDDSGATTPAWYPGPVRSFGADQVAAGFMSFRLPVGVDGVRITYTNGPVGQNEFLFVFTLRVVSTLPQSDLAADVTGASVAVMTRGAILAPDDSGGWDNISRSDLGGLRVSLVEHEADTPIKALPAWQPRLVNVPSDAPVQLVANPLSLRKTVNVQNEGSGDVFIGTSFATTAAASTRRRIFAASEVEFDLEPDGDEVWCIADTFGGASTGLTRLDPATINNTGATDPNNALTSDDARATLADDTDALEATDFTADETYDEVTQVVVGFEGRKESGQTQTPTREEGSTGTTSGGTAATTAAALTAVDGDAYYVFVSMRDTTEAVQSVTGLGLTWAAIGSAVVGTNGVSEVWEGTGTPTGDGTVSVNFASTVTSAIIAASRWSGVASRTRYTNTGTTAAWTVATTSATGNVVFGCCARRGSSGDTTNTPGAPDVEYTDVAISGGAGLRQAQTTQSRVVTTSDEPSDGTWASAGPWVAIALVLVGAAAIDPVATISYDVDGTPGATTSQVTVTATSDTDYEVDVTGDRAWTFADINTTSVQVTVDTIGAAELQVDHIYLDENNAESGATQPVSTMEVGG